MIAQHIPLFKYKEFLEKIVEKDSLSPCGVGKLIFRCPVCGDSKKSKTKKRGYLLTSPDGKATIGCLNCEFTSSFYYFLKVNYPNLCKDWIMDVLFFNGDYEKIEESFAEEVCYVDYSQFLPLTCKDNVSVRNACINLINARRIPKHIAKKFLYAHEGKYANRLIIPHYNRDGGYQYFEARDLTGKSMMKYKYPPAMPQLFYNLNFINKNIPYYIFEGGIDSMFVANSVATGGATKLERFLEDVDAKFHQNAIIVFDGDRDGIKKSFKMLKRGYRVFVWSKEMLALSEDGKIDMNMLVTKGFFDSDLNELGQIPEEVIMKYVMKPTIENLLEFEMYYNELGIVVEEEKKNVGFIDWNKKGNKNNSTVRKGGVRKGLHRK